MDRRVITFEQFAPNCKHRMGSCGMRMGSMEQIQCAMENCPILRQLPSAEPIIEAAKEEWSRLNFLGRKEELERLSEALSAIGEVKFKNELKAELDKVKE